MNISSFLKHIAVFVVIEVFFVLVIFHEFPHISLYSTIGVLHVSYWVLLILTGWIRDRFAKHIWTKFLCTYLPVVYHLLIHLYIGWKTVEVHGHDHEHSLWWMIASVGLLGVMIWIGEWYLHRALHCQTHHQVVHSKCEDDCEHVH